MTRISSFIVVSLLICALHFTSISAQDATTATQTYVTKDFDAKNFLNHRWYAIVFADTVGSGSGPFLCTDFKFSSICSAQCFREATPAAMVMQSIWLDANGLKYGGNDVVKPVKNGPQGAWHLPASRQPTSFHVVDRCKDYSWIAFVAPAESYTYMFVISRTPQNEAAKAIGFKLAAQYGLEAQVNIQDAKKCDYKALEAELLTFF